MRYAKDDVRIVIGQDTERRRRKGMWLARAKARAKGGNRNRRTDRLGRYIKVAERLQERHVRPYSGRCVIHVGLRLRDAGRRFACRVLASMRRMAQTFYERWPIWPRAADTQTSGLKTERSQMRVGMISGRGGRHAPRM